jgi:hypothetical protein
MGNTEGDLTLSASGGYRQLNILSFLAARVIVGIEGFIWQIASGSSLSRVSLLIRAARVLWGLTEDLTFRGPNDERRENTASSARSRR